MFVTVLPGTLASTLVVTVIPATRPRGERVALVQVGTAQVQPVPDSRSGPSAALGHGHRAADAEAPTF
jgi:hypothetical protein